MNGVLGISRAAVTVMAALVTLLPFTRAPVQEEDWEHLYRGSRLVIGKKSAWRVSQPIDLSPAYVVNSVMSSRTRQAILMTTAFPPDQPPEGDLTDEDEAFPSTFHVIDLDSGRVKKKIELAYDPFLWLTPFHPGGRLFPGQTDLRPVFTDFNPPMEHLIYDAKTGKVFKFGDRFQRMPVYSSHPDVVCYWRTRDPEGRSLARGKDDPVTYDLVDFRVQPPRHTIYKLKEDADPSEAIDDDLCLIFEGREGIPSKRRHWKRQIETGRTTPITESEFNQKRNITGFYDEQARLTLEQKSGENFLIEPGGGVRWKFLLEVESGNWDSSGNPPIFIAYKDGLAKLYHTFPVDHHKAVEELHDHAKKAARAYASEVAKGLRRWVKDHQGMLPESFDEFKKAVAGSADEKILAKFLWLGASQQKVLGTNLSFKTELGHLAGPGGRAVIFADFHVEWVAD